MFRFSWKFAKYAGIIACMGAGLFSVAAQEEAASSDAHRLKTGTFTYRTMSGGKEEGQSRIAIQANAEGNFAFSANITGAFDQSWESIATAQFHAVSASLSFGGKEGRKQSFDLKYSDGHVTGFAAARRTSPARAIDDAVPVNVVDQRIDWAAVLASDLKAGNEFRFEVYDPWTGISKAVAHVGPVERVQVPAGAFVAYRVVYRIEKSTGAETYQVLASEETPRVMVREDFPDGAIAELVQIEP